jgi:hypothetical protein
LRPTTPSATAVEQSWWSNLYAFAAVAGCSRASSAFQDRTAVDDADSFDIVSAPNVGLR